MKKDQAAVAAEPINRPLLHSIERTAELLGGVSQKTVYREIARGDLCAVKLGRNTKVTDESLRRRVASLPPATIRQVA